VNGPTGVVSQLDISACPAGPIYVELDARLTCADPGAQLQGGSAPAQPLLKGPLKPPRITSGGQ
jgi:hypothetical protein